MNEMQDFFQKQHALLAEYDVSNKVGNTIETAFVKTWIHIIDEAYQHKKILVAVSGGSDSDIVIDMIERVGYPNSELHYVFYDTGMEYQATKRHIDYLESKYGITIERERAYLPVPLSVKKYGMPFLNKRVSEYIHRLQLHDFRWEDAPFDVLYAKYPKCKGALRWWCNEWGENSQMNINRNKWLKEFLIENPPQFSISSGCCDGAKKKTGKKMSKRINADLEIYGLRHAEGGQRASGISSCFDERNGKANVFRPIWWFNKAAKEAYEAIYDIKHSDCYEKYCLPRTGCACCPFGKGKALELNAAMKYEPNLYKAAYHVFGAAYEYEQKYRDFLNKMDEEAEERENAYCVEARRMFEKQMSLFH